MDRDTDLFVQAFWVKCRDVIRPELDRVVAELKSAGHDANVSTQEYSPVADHLRFYRLAHEHVWRWLYIRITAAARDAVEQATAVELATGWLFAFADRATPRIER